MKICIGDIRLLIESVLFETIDIESHLLSRGIDPARTRVISDKSAGIATFLLFNTSGKLVGYQQYNPSAPKSGKIAKDLMKYYTYVSKLDNVREIAVWGLETVNVNDEFIFIVEGIFDAVKIHNAGYPALAVLSNDPKHIRSWLRAMNKFVVVIEDNDASAGRKLASIGNASVKTPDPYKDLGEMPQDEVNEFLRMILSTYLR